MKAKIWAVRIGSATAVVALALAPSALSSPGDGTIVSSAGNGTRGSAGDGGQGTEASLDQPRSVFATADGGFIWAQPWSNTVRKVGPDGIVTRIAGTGAAGFSGDGGQATGAQINFVHSAAPTSDGGYLLADTINNRIRKVGANGTIATVAGTGSASYSGDNGPATAAAINNPRGIVALPAGGFLIPDSNNHRVRKVASDGTITTVAGTGVQGFSGDNGPATAAQLSIPFGVAPTADGGFLIVDVGNQRIRKVAADGTITTVAGNGTPGYSGDGGPATAASLRNPHNVAALADGGFLIADTTNLRVRRVSAGGTIETVVGTGVLGFSGDGGPASAAQLAHPKAVALTAAGDVLIADEQNERIRFVGTPIAPGNVSPPTVSGQLIEGRILTAAAGGWSGTGPTFAYQWQRCDATGSACADISGAVSKTYALVEADVGSTMRVSVSGTNVAGSATALSVTTAVVQQAGEPPTNVTPPTISGIAQDGQVLTADEGVWTGTLPLTYSYQWQRCNASGTACVSVAGATAKTYAVTPGDVGSTLTVRVIASNDAGSRYAASILADSPRSYWRAGDTGGTLVDQQNVASGVYVGNPQQGAGALLTGDLDPAVTLNGSSQYLEIPADPAWTPSGGFSIEILVRPSTLPVNRTIWAVQSGSFTGWWLNTGQTGVVRMFIGDGSAWRLDSSGPVLQPGETHHLVATYDGTFARLYVDGALSSTGPSVSMASNAGSNTMRLGSASSFIGQYWPGTLDEPSFYPAVLTPGEVQKHYEVSSTGSSATSAPTGVVVASAPANSAPPSISGTAAVGQTLTASAGSWTGTPPITYAYQWRRCDSSGGNCADIASATASTYALVSADQAATIRVRVTASNSAGSSFADSAQTAVVAAQSSSGALTVSVTSGSDDGDVAVGAPQNQNYPPSGTPAANSTGTVLTAGRRLAFGNFTVLNGLLRFDTSALPDGATVTSATLKLRATAKADADNRALQAEWYPASNWPIDAADWSLDSTASALAGADLTAISLGQVNSFALAGLGSISTTGATALRLHVSGGEPAGDNYLQLAALEHASLPEAQLVLEWTLP